MSLRSMGVQTLAPSLELRQYPARKCGGSYRSDGTAHFVDTKGVLTDSFKIKKREVEALYPFEVEIV